MRRALLSLAIVAAALVPPLAVAQSVDACRRAPEPASAPCAGNACRPGVRTAVPPVSVAVTCAASSVSTAVAAPSGVSGPASGASGAAAASATDSASAAELRRAEHELRSWVLKASLAIAAVLTLAALMLMLRSSGQARRDGGLRATSHWGGFGGAGGGWQVAPALASLLAAGVLALAAAVIVAGILDATRPAASATK